MFLQTPVHFHKGRGTSRLPYNAFGGTYVFCVGPYANPAKGGPSSSTECAVVLKKAPNHPPHPLHFCVGRLDPLVDAARMRRARPRRIGTSGVAC